jgi:hypothetical protein
MTTPSFTRFSTDVKGLCCCLLLAACAAGQTPAPKQRAALEAQIINLGRSGAVTTALAASFKITNNSDSYVYLLLFGLPSAIDDAGGNFGIYDVTGAAYCPGPQSNPPSFRLCVGIPRVDDHLFPLHGYTEIGPTNSVTVNYVFRGGGNKGTKYFLAQEIAFRVAKSPEDDAALSDQQKLKLLHFASLNFNAVEAPPKEVVISRITFGEVK